MGPASSKKSGGRKGRKRGLTPFLSFSFFSCSIDDFRGVRYKLGPWAIREIYHGRTVAAGFDGTMTALAMVLWGSMLVVFVGGCLLPPDRLPPRLPNDKLVHTAAFALLALPPLLLFSPAGGPAVLAILFGLGIMVEVAQINVRGRSFSLGDIAANGVGLILAAGGERLVRLFF